MGATFVPLVQTEHWSDMAYSFVHKVRWKLIWLVDKELGEKFADTDVPLAKRYDVVLNGLEEIVEATDDEIAMGVLAFVEHSDCDGEFLYEDCTYILKALKKLKEVWESSDEYKEDIIIYGETIETLINVFSDAVDGDGMVVIW